MTENSTPQSRTLPVWVNTLRGAMEIGPKVAITGGAICYGVGLLIVSSHLAKLGVYATDLLRTEYVLAGAAFCVLTLCAVVATHYFIAFSKNAADLWKNKKRFQAAIEFILTVGGSVALFSYLLRLISTDNLASVTNWRMWLTLGIAIATYFGVRSTLSIFQRAWTNTLEQGDKKARMNHWWHVVFTLVWLAANVGVYTESVYPHLLAQYGGGYRAGVLLVTTASGGRVGHIAGLPFQPDGSIGPVQLLLENEHELIVATMDGGRAVSIARDLVEAVAEYKLPQTNAKTVKKSSTKDAAPRTSSRGK